MKREMRWAEEGELREELNAWWRGRIFREREGENKLHACRNEQKPLLVMQLVWRCVQYLWVSVCVCLCVCVYTYYVCLLHLSNVVITEQTDDRHYREDIHGERERTPCHLPSLPVCLALTALCISHSSSFDILLLDYLYPFELWSIYTLG